MYNKNLGDQIRDIVEDAVDSCNFQDLNYKIKNTADRAIDEFNHATQSIFDHTDYGKQNGPGPNGPIYGGPNHGGPNRGYGGSHHGQYNRNTRQDYRQEPWFSNREQWNKDRRREEREKYREERSEIRREAKQEKRQYRYDMGQAYQPPVKRERVVGSVSSVLFIVFGSIGVATFGIAALVLSVIWAAGTGLSIVFSTLASTFGVVTAISAVFLTAGILKRKRIKRFRKYQSLLEKNSFCEIKALAQSVNKSRRFVVKDLKKMMLLGFYKEGHIDKKKTCFISSDERYSQYLSAQESYENRLKEEKEAPAKKEEEPVNEELRKAMEDGKAYIEEIRRANEEIPGEEISKKLDRLEDIIRKIFVCVQKHPEKLSEIRKFMEYYLPITIKLLHAYKEFEAQPIQGQNITNSKQEIEATLDTIDTAFETLLDSLYEDEAMEVFSDISVLNTLFAQEGLTKKDFNLK